MENNKLQVFENDEFGKIRCLEKDGETWFVGKDIADALGYGNHRQALKTNVDDDDKVVHSMDTLGGKQKITIINESGLYSLILSSKLPTAKKFKKWVTSEVLPSIRQHGAYITPQKIEEILSNPDTIIQLATTLKKEQEARKLAEEEVKEKKKQLEYKTEIIKGVTDDIDLYTKRNVLNKVVRYKSANYAKRWSELYDRFKEVHSVDLRARCEGYNLKQSKQKDKLSVVKYAEKYGYLDDLYKIALKLYETDMNEIISSLNEII